MLENKIKTYKIFETTQTYSTAERVSRVGLYRYKDKDEKEYLCSLRKAGTDEGDKENSYVVFFVDDKNKDSKKRKVSLEVNKKGEDKDTISPTWEDWHLFAGNKRAEYLMERAGHYPFSAHCNPFDLKR